MTALGHFQPLSISRKLPFECPLLGGKAIAWEIASSLGMVLRAQLVDGVDENTEVIRIDIRRDAMTKIEDVARTFAVTGKSIRNALTNNFW